MLWSDEERAGWREDAAIPEPIEEEPTLCWVPVTRLHPDAVRYCTAVEQHGRECQGGVEVKS